LNEMFLNKKTKQLRHNCEEYYQELNLKMVLIKSLSEASIAAKLSLQIAPIKSEFTYNNTGKLIER
jgi:hypothetical protein